MKKFILDLYSEGYSTHKHIVGSLKNGIDYFVGRKDNAETVKDEIKAVCLKEFEERTKVFDKVGHLKMIEAIKTKFIQFLNTLDIDELPEVSPLPFERRLTDKECQTLETSLKTKFDFGSWKDENYYWEPLSKTLNQIPLVYFEKELFKSEATQKIVDIIKSISGNKIFLLTDENINYEVDTSSLNVYWIESAYCNFESDWLIYISHEGTITFSGEVLLSQIENALPEIMMEKNPWN